MQATPATTATYHVGRGLAPRQKRHQGRPLRCSDSRRVGSPATSTFGGYSASLAGSARSTDPTSSSAETAAIVGWWGQRADQPGTRAVLLLTVACAARWVLGVPPE